MCTVTVLELIVRQNLNVFYQCRFYLLLFTELNLHEHFSLYPQIVGVVTASLKDNLTLTQLDYVAIVNQTGVTLTQSQDDESLSISGSWKSIHRAYTLMVSTSTQCHGNWLIGPEAIAKTG